MAFSFDATTVVWRKSSRPGQFFDEQEHACLEGHDSEVKAVAWDASGTLLATCGRDKAVSIWEASEGDDDDDFDCLDIIKPGHDQDVKSVRWHPFNEWVRYITLFNFFCLVRLLSVPSHRVACTLVCSLFPHHTTTHYGCGMMTMTIPGLDQHSKVTRQLCGLRHLRFVSVFK